MILSEKIMMLRKQQGWSQEELAAKLGISRQSVSKWESATAIPDLDKILKLSSLFSVSTDYLLKDEIEFPESFGTQTTSADEFEEPAFQEPPRVISMEEANAYMDLTKKVAKPMAFAVMLFILSPVCLLQLGQMAEFGHLVSDNVAGGLGVVILLLMVACALAILIPNGMALSRYEFLEKESFSLQYGVKGVVERKLEASESSFRIHITLGIVLCILAVIPMFIAEFSCLSLPVFRTKLIKNFYRPEITPHRTKKWKGAYLSSPEYIGVRLPLSIWVPVSTPRTGGAPGLSGRSPEFYLQLLTESSSRLHKSKNK